MCANIKLSSRKALGLKVYSIWTAMSPPKERENTITRYRLVEERLVGEVEEPVQNYDLITVLTMCLGEQNGSACHITYCFP